MKYLLNSFWRAAAHSLHPRVILLSLLPLLLLVGSALLLGYFFWEPATDATRRVLESFTTLDVVWSWLDNMGMSQLKLALVPLLVIFVSTPVLVIACLLLVAQLMAPAIVTWVAGKRFPQLEQKQGGSWWRSLGVSLGSALVAVLVLIVSIPLWLIPPVILVLPPLVWGWLTYRVMSFDALSLHASSTERKAIISQHRGPLLVMGLICGYLGAAPGLVWASGTFFAVLFPVLVPFAIWLYTLVFAFSALWFTHYCLAALAQLRLTQEPLKADFATVHSPDLQLVASKPAPEPDKPDLH